LCLWKKNEYVFHINNDELKMQEIEDLLLQSSQ